MEPVAGELVVRNGKRAGARLPLRTPVTVIGSADGCDVKLAGDGLGPVHCAVILSPEGVSLRSWHPDQTWVNDEPRAAAALADGDELKVGPCVFRVELAAASSPVPPEDVLAAEAAQLAGVLDARRRQVEAHEAQVTAARADLRAERDRTAGDRAEAARLKRNATALHRDASRERDRSRKAVGRFVRQFGHKWADTRRQFEEQVAAFAAEKERHAAEVARFEAARSDFNTRQAADRDRQRAAWAAVEERQKRLAAEWAEGNEFAAKREAALDTRAADLTAREKAITAERTKRETEAAALRAEVEGLEARARHARAVVGELERTRDRLRADRVPPLAASQPAVGHPQLHEERARLGREAADLADRRKVVAEQFAQLAVARARWQRAERQTVAEMEALARGLAHREQELDVRERHLFRADARRRAEAHDLWRLRLALESGHATLTARQAAGAADRERAEANVARRVRAVAAKEATIDRLFATWDAVRRRERERVEAEVGFWAEARDRLVRAAADHDEQRRHLVGELALHAARAMAAEEAATDRSPRAARRRAVLAKRWERAFDRKRREVEAERAAAAGERAALDARFGELHRLAANLAARDAALSDRAARVDAAALPALPAERDDAADRAASAELAALRAEVERVAAVLVEADVPDAPEEAEGVLPFARAA